MLRRLLQVFRRYADRHAVLELPGLSLFDETGRQIGRVERMHWCGGRLTVAGWADAGTVALLVDGRRVETAPLILREDVSAALPELVLTTPGFEVAALTGAGRPYLSIESGTARYIHPLPEIDAGAIRGIRRRELLPFALALAAAAPAMLAWRTTRSPEARAQVKRALGLGEETLLQQIGPGLFAPAPPDLPGLARTPVTIVIPVFNALDLLKESLSRVVANTDLPWHLVAVEDCSTDTNVRPWLRDWAAAQNRGGTRRVTLIENQANLGFVGSVNRGFEAALERGDHVVLLNSDALVPPGWARRLLRPLVAGKAVASVTPMSNDAEIMNVPVICRRAVLEPGQGDRIDARARDFHPDADVAEVPTGVGFCMAMNIAFLRQIPQFDTVFGRGYGEEVDWCQKARARGGRHLALPGLFVEHRGGESFGSDEKLRLIQANNAVIAKRYGGYDRAVQDFIRNDPLARARLALGIALAAAQARGPVPVYLAHSLGGGADHYLDRRIADDLGPVGPGVALVIRVGGAPRWQIELCTPLGATRGATAEFAVLEQLLEPLGSRRIVYSNGVGDPDPVELPARLLDLRTDPDAAVEVLFHDYFPISPSYTLLDSGGRFAGLPDPAGSDPAHRRRRPDGSWVPLADWQAAWGRLMEAATAVTVFSESGRALVAAAFPAAAEAIRVVPHRLAVTPEAVPRPPVGAPPVIGVLGNIGHQKGAAVLARLSEGLASGKRAQLVLIGNIDPAYALARNAIVHGDYRPEDIAELALRYGITCWLIPSIWPETFSYTTHEALATGLPVWCFDLGAQAEAVRRAVAKGAPGGVIALEDGDAPVARLTERILSSRRTEPA